MVVVYYKYDKEQVQPFTTKKKVLDTTNTRE